MDIQRSIYLIGNLILTEGITFDVPIFILMIVLIFCSAFFSMAETVFSTVSETKLQMLVEDRVSGSRKALNCASHFERTLSTVLVGNNIVNIALATVSVGFFAKLILNSQWVETISTASITVVVLIFGEVMPKTLAKNNAEKIAVRIGWFVYFLSIILFPIVGLLMLLQKLLTKHIDESKPTMDEDQLEKILDTMEEDGAIKTDEVNLIKNVFDLDDRCVEDIMVPRIEMTAVPLDAKVDEVKQLMVDAKYSRVPVYKTDKDHIVGILYQRDYFTAMVRGTGCSVRRLMRPVKFVPANMKVSSLIHELQKGKSHMAIVSGEYGDTLGLVTMEDALEELVGEIYDEHDKLGEDDLIFEANEDGSYIVDGDMYVEDMFDRLNLGDMPEDIPNKVSSWIYSVLENMPEVGYKLETVLLYTKLDEETDEYKDYAKKLILEIASVVGRRIQTVKATVVDATEEEIEEAKRAKEED